MGKKRNNIAISMEEVTFIFSDNPDDFTFFTSNCFCTQCKSRYSSTITNYSIFLNDLYDIELDGFCKKCNHKMGRYLETGENPATVKKAEATWKTHKILKELKIRKAK